MYFESLVSPRGPLHTFSEMAKVKLKKSELCAKLKRGRLGITTRSNRVDDCIVCGRWRNSLSKRLAADYNESKVFLKSKCPKSLKVWVTGAIISTRSLIIVRLSYSV